MGYVAHIDFSIQLKDRKTNIEELKKQLKNQDFWEAISYHDPEFNVTEDKTTLCAGYDDSYWEDDWHKFLDFIAPYIKDGEIIECMGEDFQLWGFRFKDGKWKEVEGRVVYDD